MLSSSQTALVRYGAAVLFVGIALVAATQVDVLAARTPFALFFVAVAAATWFGGRRPGIVAFILGAVTAHYVLMPPVNSFKFNLYGAIQFCVFFVLSFLIIKLIETLQKRNLAIVETERHYRLLLESDPLPMWVIDPKTSEFLAVNDSATSSYGYTRAEFLNLTIEDIQADEVAQASGSDRSETAALTDPGKVSRHKRKDGGLLYVEVISHDLIFNGRPARMIHTVDVSDRIKASDALQTSEVRLQKVFGNCPVAMLVNRWSDRAFVDVNAEFTRLTGWTRDEVLGRTIFECGLVDAEVSGQLLSYLRKHGTVTDRELEIKTKLGENLRVLVGSVFVEMFGETHVVTTLVNITEHHRALEKQRASEERLRMVTDNASVGLVMINGDRRFAFANSAYADIFDLPAVNLVGRSVADVHPMLYEMQICPKLDRAFAGASLSYELRRPTPDGDRFYEVRYEPTTISGTVSQVVAEVTDVTVRSLAELARQASEERYHTLFEYAPDGIVIADRESYYINANDSICRMLGYNRNELIGLHATDIIVPKDIPHLGDTLDGLNADLEYYQEWQFRRKNGSVFPGEVMATMMPDGNTLTVIRDTTERKQLEEQLLQAQKMEAIGVLAGGVAHDFNNILTAISGNSGLALQNMAPDDPLRNYIVEIKDAGVRAAGLTSQLLAFSRKRVLMPTVHSLNLAVSDTEKMLRRIVKENIEFQIVLDPALGNIKADPGQIAQVIVNLVVNAGDAMPDGGTLTIETKGVVVDEHYSADHIEVSPGRFAELIISDTGIGMDEQTQRRLFEPFYTTKDVGKGTGLGLSTAYGIVKQSGGDIAVQSEIGRGSTFRVYLPCVDEAIAELPVSLKRTEISSGTETILLVEDEVSVRNLVNNVLTRQGYRVLEADSGSGALSVCKSYPKTINLLLSDMIMPKMSGTELKDEVLKVRPNVKLLFMSGYTGDAIGQNGALPAGAAFIEKPFTPDDLVRKVREVLGEPVHLFDLPAKVLPIAETSRAASGQ
ncbi:MAG: PAS domain S-box protein [Pyrinomonadaceae bacterium]